MGCQRRAKAACSVLGSPAGWRNESVSTDFHELRQGFIPPIREMKNGLGHNVNETVFILGKPYFTGVSTMTGITRVVLRR